jgi:hypothetical protein
VPTEDGNGVKLLPETTNECYAKVGELAEMEIEISDKLILSVEELEKLELTPEEVTQILPFIVD